jgi:translation initiation factor IF-2
MFIWYLALTYFSPSQVNLPYLQRQTDLPVISISAKMGTNLQELLKAIKEVYDETLKTEDEKSSADCKVPRTE